MGSINTLINQVAGMLQKLKQRNKISSENGVVVARSLGVTIGQDCRIYPCSFGSEPYLVSIGNHVTVTNGVHFITHDGGVWVMRDEYPEIDFVRPIIIHDNCFIGINAIILPGVEVGPNSIVGAGSVVTRSIPPNTVAAGVPARVIRTLSEYKEHILPKCMPTKSLTREEKRKYLLDLFGNSPEEWKKKLADLENRDL